VKVGDVAQLFAGGQLVEQRRLLGEVADDGDELPAVGHVDAHDVSRPARGPGERRQHPHRRLPRAVGAEEAVHLPLVDRQVQPVDRQHIAEAFRQLLRPIAGPSWRLVSGIMTDMFSGPVLITGEPTLV